MRRPGTEAWLRTYDDDSVMTQERIPLERGAWPDFYAGVEQAIRGLRPTPVPITDAIADARVLDAARAAWATGTVVRLDPPAGHQ